MWTISNNGYTYLAVYAKAENLCSSVTIYNRSINMFSTRFVLIFLLSVSLKVPLNAGQGITFINPIRFPLGRPYAGVSNW